MKKLALDREYWLHLIDPETGRKSSVITTTLDDLFIAHATAQAEATPETDPGDPYVNILYDVTAADEATDPDVCDFFMHCPIFRMSTLVDLVKQEKTQ